MKPDESLFKAHLGEAPFQLGCDMEKWGLLGPIESIGWPDVIIWVRADSQIVSSKKVHLRFNPTGYSATAPTACPWDPERNARLENAKYPKVAGKFTRVFRTDWNEGTALYAPCDRVAMSGHEVWKQQFPHWWWQPHFTIVKYLEFVHMVLNPLRPDETA